MKQQYTLQMSKGTDIYNIGFVADYIQIVNYTPFPVYLRTGDNLTPSPTSYHVIVAPTSTFSMPVQTDHFAATIGGSQVITGSTTLTQQVNLIFVRDEQIPDVAALIQTTRFRTYTSWYQNHIAANTEFEVLNIVGSGYFVQAAMFIDGLALTCGESKFNLYLDGEVTPSISVRCNAYRHDISKQYGNLGYLPVGPTAARNGWIGNYDAVGFGFSGGFNLDSYFNQRLRVTIVNGDVAHQTYFDSTIVYALWI